MNNQDVMLVAYKAAASFTGVLSKEEIKGCVMKALWRAVNSYDKEENTKFTSYLHNGVVYECLSQKRSNRRRNGPMYTGDIKDKTNPFERVDMLDLIYAKCDDPSLIIDRYYKNMTINEIAKNRNVSGETIRMRLKKNIEKMKRALTNSV